MSLFGEQIPSLELKNYVMLLQGEPFLTMCYTINSSPLLFTKLFVIMPTIIFRNYQDCPVPLKPLSTSYDLWLILLTDFVEIENFECVQNSRVYIQVSILVHHKHASLLRGFPFTCKSRTNTVSHFVEFETLNSIKWLTVFVHKVK